MLLAAYRIVFWGKLRTRLNRSLHWFLKTTSLWMSQHHRGWWMSSNQLLGLYHLHWSLLLNYFLYFMTYYLLKLRTHYTAIFRSGSWHISLHIICFYLLFLPLTFDLHRLLLRKDQGDTWQRRMNMSVGIMKDSWWTLLLYLLLIKKWSRSVWT